MAGVECVLAVDGNQLCLDVHKANHPGAHHACIILGGELSELQQALTAAVGNRPYHLHMSPECKRVSRANCCRTEEGVESTISLMQWCLTLARRLQPEPASWTLEQAHAFEVYTAFPQHIVVRCEQFGVAQTRKRILMGTPQVLQRLQEAPIQTRTPAQVLTHLRPLRQYLLKLGTTNTSIKKKEQQAAEGRKHKRIATMQFVRPLSVPTYTVTQKNLFLVDTRTRSIVRTLNSRELSLLQGFPPQYQFALHRQKDVVRMVANAVPPPVAAAILKCALEVVAAPA